VAKKIKYISGDQKTPRLQIIKQPDGRYTLNYAQDDPLKLRKAMMAADLDSEVQRLFGYKSWEEYKKDNWGDLTKKIKSEEGKVTQAPTVHPFHVAYALEEFFERLNPNEYEIVGIKGSGSEDIKPGAETDTTDQTSLQPVVMFSSKGCPPCKKAIEFFKEKDIKFEKHDVSTEEGKEKLNSLLADKSYSMVGTGNPQREIPVIFVGSKYFVGFNRAIGEEILKVGRIPRDVPHQMPSPPLQEITGMGGESEEAALRALQSISGGRPAPEEEEKNRQDKERLKNNSLLIDKILKMRKVFFGDTSFESPLGQAGVLNIAMRNPEEQLLNKKAIERIKQQYDFKQKFAEKLGEEIPVIHPGGLFWNSDGSAATNKLEDAHKINANTAIIGSNLLKETFVAKKRNILKEFDPGTTAASAAAAAEMAAWIEATYGAAAATSSAAWAGPVVAALGAGVTAGMLINMWLDPMALDVEDMEELCPGTKCFTDRKELEIWLQAEKARRDILKKKKPEQQDDPVPEADPAGGGDTDLPTDVGGEVGAVISSDPPGPAGEEPARPAEPSIGGPVGAGALPDMEYHIVPKKWKEGHWLTTSENILSQRIGANINFFKQAPEEKPAKQQSEYEDLYMDPGTPGVAAPPTQIPDDVTAGRGEIEGAIEFDVSVEPQVKAARTKEPGGLAKQNNVKYFGNEAGKRDPGLSRGMISTAQHGKDAYNYSLNHTLGSIPLYLNKVVNKEGKEIIKYKPSLPWTAENIITVPAPIINIAMGANRATIKVNKHIAEPLLKAIKESQSKYGLPLVHMGAFYPKGTASRASSHTWGAAIDLDPHVNPFTVDGRLVGPKKYPLSKTYAALNNNKGQYKRYWNFKNQEGQTYLEHLKESYEKRTPAISLYEFVGGPLNNNGIARIFAKYGFLWGGNYKQDKKDMMHFEFLPDKINLYPAQEKQEDSIPIAENKESELLQQLFKVIEEAV
jgi:glutaredoxin